MKQALVTALLFIGLYNAPSIAAQETHSGNPQPNSAQKLELTLIGNGRVMDRAAAFRTYAAPDGTEALVWYGEFRSEEEARSATKQWLKGHKVTGEERTEDLEGQVVLNLIIAVPKHGGKAFIVFRRYGLHYRFISICVADRCDAGGWANRATTTPSIESSCCNIAITLTTHQRFSALVGNTESYSVGTS